MSENGSISNFFKNTPVTNDNRDVISEKCYSLSSQPQFGCQVNIYNQTNFIQNPQN
jgi:hypothetical protein